MNMTTRERLWVGLMIAGIVVCLLCIIVGAAQAAGECELIAEIQPDETEQRVEYTDPQGRELCRLKIYLHDRTVIGFAPPGGEHDGYAASFNGAHVQGHRTDPSVDLISHAQVFAIENSVTATPTRTNVPPTATETVLPPTATETALPPTSSPTLPPTLTPTLLPPTLIPPVENPTVTPTASDTPTVDIYYPPPQEGKSPPPAPRLPETGMGGQNDSGYMLAFGIALLAIIFLGIPIARWRNR